MLSCGLQICREMAITNHPTNRINRQCSRPSKMHMIIAPPKKSSNCSNCNSSWTTKTSANSFPTNLQTVVMVIATSFQRMKQGCFKQLFSTRTILRNCVRLSFLQFSMPQTKRQSLAVSPEYDCPFPCFKLQCYLIL